MVLPIDDTLHSTAVADFKQPPDDDVASLHRCIAGNLCGRLFGGGQMVDCRAVNQYNIAASSAM